MARRTGSIINVALILLAVIVLGGMLRMMSFPRILPEGFEDASKKDDDAKTEDEGDDEEDEKDDKDSKKDSKDAKDSKKKDSKDAKKKDAKDSKKKDAKDAKKKDAKVDTDGPAVDFDKNMKNFLTENSDNDALMGSLHKDAKALMKNQEQLMNMLQTTGPMLKSSMDMVKSFKGMFGSE